MLSRAFSQVSKRPLDLFVHASAVVGFGSNMPRHLHHLLGQAEPADGLPLQNSRGAPHTCNFESNWTMQHNLSTVKNSDDSPLYSKRATAGRTLTQRFEILRSIRECENKCDIVMLLTKKTAPICYVWCDPSPWIHISQGFSMSINVNKMISAGFKVKVLMADWFARMDPRIGGNLRKMQTIAMYNIEMWKATGMDLDGVEFLMLSDEISCRADEYWPLAMKVATMSEMEEITSCFNSKDLLKDTRGGGSIDPDAIREFTPAETLHACLQCASILLQEIHPCVTKCVSIKSERREFLVAYYSGACINTRTTGGPLAVGHGSAWVDMLAEEYCKHTGYKNKPVALFHDMVPSLLRNTEWNNMGDPGWGIFMEDDEEDVSRKIERAFCPPKLVEDNPCLEYVKYIVLPCLGKFEVVLKEEISGNKTFLSMEELNADYSSGAMRPADVKRALVKAINIILQPVRDHFGSCSAKTLRKAMEDYYFIDGAKGPQLLS